MNTFINKLLRPQGKAKKKSRLSSRSGQAAIVIILLIAITMFVYALSLNLGRIGQNKAVATVAADAGAGMLASQMASYGQQLFMEQLGGRIRVCKSTGLLGGFLGLFISIVIAIATGGTSLIALIAVALNVISVGLQFVVIQPAITDMWNKSARNNLGTIEQFIEQGIRTGLQRAVTDDVFVDDVLDLDTDGRFGYSGSGPVDKVSRFAVYYNKRAEGFVPRSDYEFVDEFMDAAHEFIYEGTDDWGLYDPAPVPGIVGYYNSPQANTVRRDGHPCLHDPSGATVVPSQCNPCCVPLAIEDTSGVEDVNTGRIGIVNIRPTCCDRVIRGGSPASECGVSWTCGDESPYGEEWPFVFDKFYENDQNTFFSLREQIGRDDEHRDFHRNPQDPSWRPQFANQEDYSDFQREDITGYYRDTFHGTNRAIQENLLDPEKVSEVPDTAAPDRRRGWYQFFWEKNISGIRLTGVDFSRPSHCYLCDPKYNGAPRSVNCQECNDPNVNPPITQPNPADPEFPDGRYLTAKHIPQLNLPVDPSTLEYGNSNFVESMNDNVGGNPALAPDAVRYDGRFFGRFDECAEDNFLPGGNDEAGIWKPGADRYCRDLSTVGADDLSQGWPYHLGCAKHRPGGRGCRVLDETPAGELDSGVSPGFFDGENDCDCGEVSAGGGRANPSLFREDVLDTTVYETIPEFVQLIENLKNIPKQEFLSWYHQIAPWIEKEGGGGNCVDCDHGEGLLYIFQDALRGIEDRFNAYLDNDYVGGGCNDVWCAPQLSCPNLPENERTFIDAFRRSSANPIGIGSVHGLAQISLFTVIACLDYNIDGPGVYDSPPVLDQGNSWRFKRCLDACGFDIDVVDTTRSQLELANRVCAGNAHHLDTPDHPLPRSLLPESEFDRLSFVWQHRPHLDILDEILAAPEECSACRNACAEECVASGTFAVDPETGGLAIDPETGEFVVTPGGEVDGECLEACYQANDCIERVDCPCTDLLVRGECYEEKVLSRLWSCNPGGPFYKGLEKSYYEALNQEEKFRHRRDLLKEVLEDARRINRELRLAQEKIQEFLGTDRRGNIIDRNAPAQALINARRDFDENEPSKVTYHAVYGWRSKDQPDGSAGYWHIVRVDARSPEQCDGACGGESSIPWEGEETTRPWVRTYTKRFKTKRCFKLENTDGGVKFRVSRYDASSEEDKLFFPNGQPIWKFSFSRPDREVLPSIEAETLGEICPSIPNPPGAQGSNIYGGAFIMNRRDDAPRCWDEVHRLLAKGITSERCAQYFYHEGMRPGLSFEFFRCPPRF